MKPPRDSKDEEDCGSLIRNLLFNCGSVQDTETLTLHCPVLRTGWGSQQKGMERREGEGGAGLHPGSPSLGHEILSSEALFLTQEDHADFLYPPGSPDPTWGRPQTQPGGAPSPTRPALWEGRDLRFTTLSSSIPSLRPGPPCHTLVNSSFHKVVITH